jgi:hypothetical protein
MTLPTYPSSISVAQVRSEFGLPSDSLSGFYNANGYVPKGAVGFPPVNGTPTPTAIPASGKISLANMYGASSFTSANTIGNWWTYRGSLFRSNIGSIYSNNNASGGSYASGSYNYNAYPGYDTYTVHGTQGPSSGSIQTYTPTFTFGATGMYSNIWTIIVVVAQSYDTGDTTDPAWTTYPYCPGYSGTLVNNIKINGFLCAVYQVTSGPSNTPPAATATYTWRNYSSGNNTGSQLNAMAIPGAWYLSSQINNPNSVVASTYSYNIGANQFSIFLGSDYANAGSTGQAQEINEPLSSWCSAGELITSNPSGLNSLQYQQYWWNSTAVTFNFNTTSGTLTQTVGGSYSYTVGKSGTTTVQGGLCTAGLGVILIFSQS